MASAVDYSAKDDAHHLGRAREIMANPKRHAAAKQHLAMQAQAADGLRKAFPETNPDHQNYCADENGETQAAQVKGKQGSQKGRMSGRKAQTAFPQANEDNLNSQQGGY